MRRVFALVALLASGCTFRLDGLASSAGSDDGFALAGDFAVGGGRDLATGAGDLAAVDMAGCRFALCEDFETGTLASRWSKSTQRGSVAVDQMRVHGGSWALHLHTSSSTPNNMLTAHISERQTFPALATGLYARAFIYMPSPSPASTADIFQMSQATPSQGDQVTIGAPGGSVMFYQYNTNPDVSTVSATSLPTDRWVCLEWEMLSGQTRTWLDGNELTDLNQSGLKLLTFDTFTVALDFYSSSNQPAYDLFVDDIALDGARVGCN